MPQSWSRGLIAAAMAGLLSIPLQSPALAYTRPGATERVSLSPDGIEADGASDSPAISADGRYVVFQSTAKNLAPNGGVVVRDRESGTTRRIAPSLDGVLSPSISAGGRFIAFDSFHDIEVPDPPGGFTKLRDIFVYDNATGSTEQVSVGTGSTLPNHASLRSAISADGRFVAFSSSASNLVPDDTNGIIDVFVHDRVLDVTERVSLSSQGVQGNAPSGNGWASIGISGDGRFVTFDSDATNLVAQDTNLASDVFIHDRKTGETERVSVADDGAQGDRGSQRPSISADGRYVAFDSWAANFVPGDGDKCAYLPIGPLAGGTSCGESDVFVHDRDTGTIERVSVDSNGSSSRTGPRGGNSWAPSISADGRYVAFYSSAVNFDPRDDNGVGDVYVHDREAATTSLVSVASDGSPGQERSDGVLGSTDRPAISADGRFVAFGSAASNLVPGDANGRDDVFVHDRGPAVGVGDLQARYDITSLSLAGWATFSGTSMARAEDPADDGVNRAAAIGAELVGASLTYRPEAEDVLVKLDLSSLPTLVLSAQGRRVNGGVGLPGVVYGLNFEVGDVAYVVRSRDRMTPDGGTPDPVFAPPEPTFVLDRCEAVCSEVAILPGAIGTTGSQVRISLPVKELEVGPGRAITETTGFTAFQGDESGHLDELRLPDVSLPQLRVDLGVAPAGTHEEDVVFDAEAALADGAFSGSLDVSSLSHGAYEAWARACLGQECGPATAAPLTLGEVGEKVVTTLELTVPGRGQEMTLSARLTAVGSSAEGIADRTIDFYSDGELIGSVQTDSDGVAAITLPPHHRGANRTYEAVFTGDDVYLGSSDERSGKGSSAT